MGEWDFSHKFSYVAKSTFPCVIFTSQNEDNFIQHWSQYS